jgi:hypothetical protein
MPEATSCLSVICVGPGPKSSAKWPPFVANTCARELSIRVMPCGLITKSKT